MGPGDERGWERRGGEGRRGKGGFSKSPPPYKNPRSVTETREEDAVQTDEFCFIAAVRIHGFLFRLTL